MTSIQEIVPRIKKFFAERKDELYTLLIIVLVAFLAFGLGRLSVYYGEKGDLKILYPEGQRAAAAAALPLLASFGGDYVGSRTSTAYYFPWCGLAKTIPEEKRVYFKSKADAERSGYSAGRCSGL